VQVAFVVVALTIVRKARGDAALLLAGGAGMGLLTTIITWLAYVLVPWLVPYGSWPSSGGVASLDRIYAAISLGSSLMYVLAQILVIAGVVRLARPERPAMQDPGRYE
jgi:hypothetical protein